MNRRVILLHIGFWVFFLSLKFFDYQQRYSANQAFILVVIPQVFNIAVAYFHYLLLLPLLVRKKYFRYSLLLVPTWAFFVYVKGETEFLLFMHLEEVSNYFDWTFGRVVHLIWGTGSYMLFMSLVKFTMDRFDLESEKKALQNEKLAAELNYLKAQINPHFLFNTLHNLHYLIEMKNAQASEVILKLSGIMRYMIYDANKPMVLLSKEIDYIENYLSLEALRLNDSFELTFDIPPFDSQLQIAPLLLITLVENAFKHGIGDGQEENWLHISLSWEGNTLAISVANSVENRGYLEEQAVSGFGLSNLRKRLALTYPDRHSLIIRPLKRKFEVYLSIVI